MEEISAERENAVDGLNKRSSFRMDVICEEGTATLGLAIVISGMIAVQRGENVLLWSVKRKEQ